MTRVQKHVLNKLSNQVLDHFKESGLFDHMRMKLLDELERSNTFASIKREFDKELTNYLTKEANLGLPRARLREKLKDRQQKFKSTNSLEENIKRIYRRHQDELRSLYNKEACSYLRTKVIKTKTKLVSPTAATNTPSGSGTGTQPATTDDGQSSKPTPSPPLSSPSPPPPPPMSPLPLPPLSSIPLPPMDEEDNEEDLLLNVVIVQQSNSIRDSSDCSPNNISSTSSVDSGFSSTKNSPVETDVSPQPRPQVKPPRPQKI